MRENQGWNTTYPFPFRHATGRSEVQPNTIEQIMRAMPHVSLIRGRRNLL